MNEPLDPLDPIDQLPAEPSSGVGAIREFPQEESSGLIHPSKKAPFLDCETNTPDPSKVVSSSRAGHISSKMWLRRFRWWAWIYTWIVLGLLVLTASIVGGSSYAYFNDPSRLIPSYALQDFLICRGFEWFLGMWIFVVGCCVASFLNVVAYRLPIGLSVNGHSFCPHCKVAIEKRDNIPILGWLYLQGRCRACKIRISSRYPIFEAIGGVLMLSIFVSTILSHGANLPSVHQQFMPYGLPVNLRFMEPIVFAFAALHAWVLLVLYTAALTRIGGGQLPVWVWIMSVSVVYIAIAAFPELVVLPVVRPSALESHSHTHLDHTAFDDSGHYLISTTTAAMTTGLGTLVALVIGTVTNPSVLSKFANRHHAQAEPMALATDSPRDAGHNRRATPEASAYGSEDQQTEPMALATGSPRNAGPIHSTLLKARQFFMWLGPCVLIGSALGFEALLGILLLSALGRLMLRGIAGSQPRSGSLRWATKRFISRGPISTLWFFAAAWLGSWSYFHPLFFSISKSGTVVWTDLRNIAVLSITPLLLILNTFWEISSDAILTTGEMNSGLTPPTDHDPVSP